ncbi:hypothetical protein GXW82_30385 [Streptacidiphilus sp. 4-A2]|nr:hypothetical protein [Streptacidiphilus sp. 4-A2]
MVGPARVRESARVAPGWPRGAVTEGLRRPAQRHPGDFPPAAGTVGGNLRCFDSTPEVQYGDAVNGVPSTVTGVAKGECRFGLLLPNPVADPSATPPTPAAR